MTTFACTECGRTVRTDWEAVTCTSDAPTCDPCCDLYGHADLAEGERSMTTTEGCIDAPHDHVDQCHQAGRAEVEAKYAALVAAVEGLADEIEGEAIAAATWAPVGTVTPTDALACGLRRAARIVRGVLADPAEGGHR